MALTKVTADVLTLSANVAIDSPVLSNTATGTYTLGGTPTISSPTISSPVLSGTATGTYTLGGTPTISSPALSGTATGTYTLAGTPTITNPTLTLQSENVSPFIGFRNRIINGAMVIDQRNAGASVTNVNGEVWTLDRWDAWGSAASKYTVQQNAGSVTPPSGFSKYLGVTSSSAYSVSSSDYFVLQYPIEGYNVADLAWGTADAKTITMSFWVRSSLTGTFGIIVQNGGGSRSYGLTYTISSANTWEYKTLTLAGDTTGSWELTNSRGIGIRFGLGVGSSHNISAGSWQAFNAWGVTGATSVVGTNGATFYITGVQLERGSVASSFEFRPFGTELDLCMRYYIQSSDDGSVAQYTGANPLFGWGVTSFNALTSATSGFQFKNKMRAAPTVTLYYQDGTSGAVYRVYDAAKITGCAASNISTQGVQQVYKAEGFHTGIGYYCSYTASAEL